MNGNYNARVLLNRLIELMKPNSPKIEAIKSAEEDAKNLVEVVDTENADYNTQLETANSDIETKQNEIKDTLGFKEDIIPISEKYINVIASDKIPFDMASITAGCRMVVEIKEQEIAEISKNIETISAKIKENEKKKEEAQQIIEETKPKLYQEEENRKELESLINLAVEENGRTLSKDRICPTLAKFAEFSEEEMETLSEYIIYPKKGLIAALNEKEEQKGKSTKEMLQEALGASDKNQNEKKDKNNSALDKLDKNIKNKREKSIKVIATQPQDKEVKKLTPEQMRDQYLFDTFKVTKEDIKYTPEIKNKSLLELEKDVDKLKENGIDPKTVSLKTLATNLDQFIENIKSIRAEKYNLDDQVIAKNPFIGFIPNKRVNDNLKLVRQTGLTLAKPSGKVAISVLSRKTEKLNAAINLIGGIDINYFKNNPENMAKIIGGVAARITYCQQNGINYQTANGGFEKFIYDEKEFTDLYGEVTTEIIPSIKECNKALLDTIDNPEILRVLNNFYKSDSYLEDVKLDHVSSERFKEINEIIKNNNVSTSEEILEIDGKKFLAANFYKNLSYLLSLGLDASNKDIIVASLMFNNHKTVNEVKDIEHSFDPNQPMRLAA